MLIPGLPCPDCRFEAVQPDSIAVLRTENSPSRTCPENNATWLRRCLPADQHYGLVIANAATRQRPTCRLTPPVGVSTLAPPERHIHTSTRQLKQASDPAGSSPLSSALRRLQLQSPRNDVLHFIFHAAAANCRRPTHMYLIHQRPPTTP